MDTDTWNKYGHLSSVIAGVFGVVPENSDEEANAEFIRGVRDDPDYRKIFGKELRDALTDPDLSWRELLSAGGEIFEDFTEEEGRRFVIERMWNVLFPNEPPPKVTR